MIIRTVYVLQGKTYEGNWIELGRSDIPWDGFDLKAIKAQSPDSYIAKNIVDARCIKEETVQTPMWDSSHFGPLPT